MTSQPSSQGSKAIVLKIQAAIQDQMHIENDTGEKFLTLKCKFIRKM
jgi:hypothetical protein